MPGHRYEKGHPAHYTGGSVPGHAPTNPNGNAEAFVHRGAPRFGTAEAEANRRKGGRQAKNKERLCLEAIQNQSGRFSRDSVIERLSQRFPTGMVKRLLALHDVCEDTDHKDFIQAQRLAREILTTLKKQPGDIEEGDALSVPGSGDTITVMHGRIDVPMPGAAEPENALPGSAAEDGGRPGAHGS